MSKSQSMPQRVQKMRSKVGVPVSIATKGLQQALVYPSFIPRLSQWSKLHNLLHSALKFREFPVGPAKSRRYSEFANHFPSPSECGTLPRNVLGSNMRQNRQITC